MANGLTKLIDLAQDANATAPKLPAPNQLAALLALKALAKLERENRSVRTMWFRIPVAPGNTTAVESAATNALTTDRDGIHFARLVVVEKNPGEQPHLVLAVIYDGDLASAFQFLVDNGTSLMLFQAVNANIERQFEFIQASWINSTLSSTLLTLAADKDPILGAHDETGTFAMPGSPPIFAWKLPRFVRVRGNAYFLLPSLSALDELVNGYTGPWPFPTRGAPAAPHFRNPDQASPPASP